MRTRCRRPEDLGRMGEDFFDSLVKDAGLVANKSNDDRAGWDFEVEHPSPRAIDYSSQSRPVYRVQVKSTMSKSRKVAISYSSLMSLIQFSGPAFLFLVHFGEHPFPLRAYLLPVTESLAKSILLCVRQKEVHTSGFKVNRSKTTITFDQGCRLTELTGDCLGRMFEAVVAPTYLDYVKTKTAWLQGIETDSTRKHFNLRFENEEAVARMANCFLGYEQPFNVTSVKYVAPLGIPGAIPPHPEAFKPTTVKPIEDKLEKAIVRLGHTEFGPKYAFSAVIYTVPKQLPKKFAAMRFKTALFEIVVRFDQGIEFNSRNLLDTELKASMKELHGFMSYIKESRNHGTTYLEVEPLNGGAPLKLPLDIAPVADDDEVRVYDAFNAAYVTLAGLDLTEELIRPSVVFTELQNFVLLQIVDKEYMPELLFEFASEAEPDASTNAVIFTSTIHLEATTVIFHSAFFGSVERMDPKTLRGHFSRSELLGHLLIPCNADAGAPQKEQEERLRLGLRERGFSAL